MTTDAGNPRSTESPRILILGATGYVGRKLLNRLEQRAAAVRCLARHPDELRPQVEATTEVLEGDVLTPATLGPAMVGVRTVYYLVHLMAGDGSADFEEKDRQAARNVADAARQAGVHRIVYLGGLGDDADPDLSPHLRSRHEVGQILKESGVPTVELRAAAVLGNGSASFDMLKALTDRLPVMLAPRWLSTPTQPIAVDDIVAYLEESNDLSDETVGNGVIYEVGAPDTTTYGGLIRAYARHRGLRRVMISVPVLTPYLSGLWLHLVTPASSEVGRHLIEGLRNPTVVRNDRARSDFAVKPMTTDQAIAKEVAAMSAGLEGTHAP